MQIINLFKHPYLSFGLLFFIQINLLQLFPENEPLRWKCYHFTCQTFSSHQFLLCCGLLLVQSSLSSAMLRRPKYCFFRRTDFDFDFDFEQIHRSTTRKYPIAEKQRNINVSKHEKLLGLNLNRINFHVRWSRVLWRKAKEWPRKCFSPRLNM